MEHDLVLEGKVVKSTGIEDLQVGISDGKVAQMARQGVRGGRKIRTERALIFPGFIDVHVHLREPGWEQKEDFRTGTAAAIHGGVTAVVDMPNNPIPAVTPEVLREKIRLAGSKALLPVRFLGGVADGALDGIGRIREWVVGYKIYLSSTTGSVPFPSGLLGEAFARISETGLPVSLHCEDQGVIDEKTRELERVDRQDIHSDVRPPEAEISSVSKVVAAMGQRRGIRANVCHVSTEGALDIISRARSTGLNLDCEATLHHLYFSRRTMLETPLLKTNPPLRSEEDRQALLRGVATGEVSFLVTDHAPHTLEEKTSRGLSGIPGLDDFAHLVSWLIKAEEVDPVTIARLASLNPARYLGLTEMGEVAPGRSADFSVIDLDSPEKVRSDQVWSKCGWSPYEGREFPGRARWTISRGMVRLDDFELAT